MVAIGHEQFERVLAGFRSTRDHFLSTPYERNLPALMGLLDRLVHGAASAAETVAVLPYEQYLERFPAYLQQLTME